MSRIGKKPIPLPSAAKVKIEGNNIFVSGPKGTLSREIPPQILIEQNDKGITVRCADESRSSSSMSGLARTLINNMVQGVTKGFTKELILTGVGYKAEEKGKELLLSLGYSSPVSFMLPDGITAKVERQKEIKILLVSHDKELLGQTAARIRALRQPEPYKGKGIRYSDERILRKAGKAAAKK